MRTLPVLFDATWTSDDLKDERVYNNLARRLGGRGRLVVSSEIKQNILHTYKERVYALPTGTVRLLETSTTNLVDRYVVKVQVDVYARSQRIAQGLLEDILDKNRS